MSPRRSGGRIASVVNALGHTTRSTHDRFGNLTKVEDALGRVVTTVYDDLQRKVIETAPEGNFVTTTYDARSNVVTKVETPKPASGLAARTVFIKTYDTLCNMELTAKDALVRTTTTAINQTTCQVTSVTQPAVNASPRSRPIPTTASAFAKASADRSARF